MLIQFDKKYRFSGILGLDVSRWGGGGVWGRGVSKKRPKDAYGEKSICESSLTKLISLPAVK